MLARTHEGQPGLPRGRSHLPPPAVSASQRERLLRSVIAAVSECGYQAVTVADIAGHVPATVTQALSVLQADTFIMIAPGFAIFGIAAGLAVLRTGALSRRLGWLSLA